MNKKRIIPNLFTACNLLAGSVAVFLATQNAFIPAFCCILLGVFFDFFDGMTARALGVVNATGVEFDSLADDITSGLAPAMMLACYLRPIIGWWCMIGLLMAAFAGLRLAKFNTDERQTTTFIGLATPANAIFWGGITCMPYTILTWYWMPWVLLGLSLVSCYLMICEIPFFSLKFHSLKWSENKFAFVFLIGCFIILLSAVIEAARLHHGEFIAFGCTFCILWYVVFNLIIQRIK